MADRVGKFWLDNATTRLKEIRRGEFAPEVSIADSSIPGSGLFFSTDNEMMVAGRVNVFRTETTGTFDTTLWTAAVVGTGTVGHTTGELDVGTGVTANSTARATTPKLMRQMSGTTQYWISVVRLNNLGSANNVRRWGIYDDNDGFFFELNGTTFNVVSRKSGVDTAVPYASCNGPAVETFNPATDLLNMNQFNIFFGGLSCRWQVNGRVLHSIGANAIQSPLTARLTLPFRLESNNSGGSIVNNRVFSRGISFHRVSPSSVAPRYLYTSAIGTTTVKSGAGTLHRIAFSPSGGSTTVVNVFDAIGAQTNPIGAISIPTGTVTNFVDYGLEFDVGLTVTTTVNNNLTVIYD